MKRIFLPLLLLALGAVLSACSGSGTIASSWPGLTVDGNIAYVAYNQHVYAVDVTNGAEKWRFPAQASNKITFFAAPTLTPDGQLLAGSFDHTLYSIDPANGSQKWAFLPGTKDTPGATDRYIGSPLATDKGIFAPNADRNLYALDAKGNYRWSFKTERAQWAKPVSDPDCNCIYVPSMDHYLYSIDSQTGAQNWKTDLGGAIVSTPAYDPQGRLYIGTFNNEMLAIDAGTGRVLWRTPASNWVWGGPVLKDGKLYFGDIGSTFYALDAASGKEVWKLPLDGLVTDTPLVTDDTIYFGTEAGTLYAVDLNGKEKWKQPIKDGDKTAKLYTSPALAGDTLLVTSVGTQPLLYAFDLNGTQKWAPFTPQKK